MPRPYGRFNAARGGDGTAMYERQPPSDWLNRRRHRHTSPQTRRSRSQGHVSPAGPQLGVPLLGGAAPPSPQGSSPGAAGLGSPRTAHSEAAAHKPAAGQPRGGPLARSLQAAPLANTHPHSMGTIEFKRPTTGISCSSPLPYSHQPHSPWFQAPAATFLSAAQLLPMPPKGTSKGSKGTLEVSKLLVSASSGIVGKGVPPLPSFLRVDCGTSSARSFLASGLHPPKPHVAAKAAAAGQVPWPCTQHSAGEALELASAQGGAMEKPQVLGGEQELGSQLPTSAQMPPPMQQQQQREEVEALRLAPELSPDALPPLLHTISVTSSGRYSSVAGSDLAAGEQAGAEDEQLVPLDVEGPAAVVVGSGKGPASRPGAVESQSQGQGQPPASPVGQEPSTSQQHRAADHPPGPPAPPAVPPGYRASHGIFVPAHQHTQHSVLATLGLAIPAHPPVPQPVPASALPSLLLPSQATTSGMPHWSSRAAGFSSPSGLPSATAILEAIQVAHRPAHSKGVAPDLATARRAAVVLPPEHSLPRRNVQAVGR
ncbi:hypothetical protein QJQ45_009541 [Haematococcus lacustris]|nr:hypothetical protein QJQ45_009541 [Haematococcus lacustris]